MASTAVRILWFVVIGWWLGPLWFVLSLILMLSIIFFPIGAYTMTKTWQVMVLSESPSQVIVKAKQQD